MQMTSVRPRFVAGHTNACLKDTMARARPIPLDKQCVTHQTLCRGLFVNVFINLQENLGQNAGEIIVGVSGDNTVGLLQLPQPTEASAGVGQTCQIATAQASTTTACISNSQTIEIYYTIMPVLCVYFFVLSVRCMARCGDDDAVDDDNDDDDYAKAGGTE